MRVDDAIDTLDKLLEVSLLQALSEVGELCLNKVLHHFEVIHQSLGFQIVVVLIGVVAAKHAEASATDHLLEIRRILWCHLLIRFALRGLLNHEDLF